MKVAKPKNAAPPKKMESCLRDRGEKIDGYEAGRGEDGWDEGEGEDEEDCEGKSDMALSGEF